jgi:hypothetical protein
MQDVVEPLPCKESRPNVSTHFNLLNDAHRPGSFSLQLHMKNLWPMSGA